MNDLSPAVAHLTQEEAEFVYNVEVIGLPARKAAEMAGMSPAKIAAPHLVQARETLKKEMRGHLRITKEDVVDGYLGAIDRARLLAEPITEIAGWKEVAKILGHDAPAKVDVNITASIEVLRGHVRNMDDAALAKLLGAGDIIDGDFYEVAQG
jgi:hypothetical protein